MAFAETARLLSTLELQDKFSGPAADAEKALGGLEQQSNFVQKSFGLIGQGAGFVGGALDHLKGRIGQLITSPLGLLGLGGGLFGIGKFFTDSIGLATEFGKVVGRLSRLTGLDTEATSRLAGAFRHFGLETDTVIQIVGLAEKNLFKLGGTAKAAAAFQDKYGLSLVDSSGKLKDFNTLLLDTADFFNDKSIPAAQKAAALAAIYGRNWQALVPILGAGREAISDAEEQAAALGLTLTKDNLAALSKLKDATRRWGDALGGLKLQLGLAVIPILTDLATAATTFLSTADEFGRTGSQKIVGFLKDMIEFGKKAFGIIQTQVVPVVQKVIEGWEHLPDPLKSLLVRGVTGNFAIKFLLGFDPIGIALAASGAVAGKLAGAAAGAIGGMFGRFIGDFFGKTAAQKLIPQVIEAVHPIPVFVVNQLPGAVPNVPTAPAAPGLPVTTGGLTIRGLLGLTSAAALGAVIGEWVGKAVFFNPATAPTIEFEKQALASAAGDRERLEAGLAEINRSILQYKLSPIMTQLNPEGLALLEEQAADIKQQIAKLDAIGTNTLGLTSEFKKSRATSEELVRLQQTEAAIQERIRGVAAESARWAGLAQSELQKIAAKKTSFSVTVPVTAVSNISVSNLSGTLTSYRIAGSGTVGGFTESAF